MTSSSSRALERQAMEAEARRMADQAHLFPAGSHEDIMQLLLQHLATNGGQGNFYEDGNDDDEDAEEEDADDVMVD